MIVRAGHLLSNARTPSGILKVILKTPTLTSCPAIQSQYCDRVPYKANSEAPTGNPPYSISPYSTVKRYNGKGDTTLHDAPPLRSAGRISSGAARGYHLVAVPPLDLGAMLTADRP